MERRSPQLELADVTLVAVSDEALPLGAAHWPVRVSLFSDWAVAAGDPVTGAPSPFYLCGQARNVQHALDTLPLAACSALGGIGDDGAGGPLLLGLLVESRVPSIPAGVPVDELPLLGAGFTKEAWEQVVSTVCHKHIETMQQMILGQARRVPEKVAVVFQEREWTFQQLCSLAYSFVDHLQMLELKPAGLPIACQFLPSDLAVVAYLGLLCGGYVIHIVDSNPTSRSYKLSACPSQALLCMRGADVDGITLPVVYLDELVLDSARPVSSLPRRPVGGLDDVAFIEYTSGSTGKPKSVATLQKRIAHWVRWRQFHFPLVPDCERAAYNLFFIWYWQIVPSQGGTMVVYPTELNHDVSAMMQYFDKHRVERTDCLTPGLISALLEVEDTLPSSLRLMISGGEALTTTTCRQWLKKWPEVPLINNYATTEKAADVCVCTIDEKVANMDAKFAPISDGCVVWQNQVDVVDGELVVQGFNIADGYLPPVESDKFFKTPSGMNAYCTGDRACWIEGKLFLQGRIDCVVKVRGHRIDLEGMEALIAGCPHVKDILVVVRGDAAWGLVVTNNLEAVRSFALSEVPQSHLITWKKLPKLPYGASGKRDRKQALRDLNASLERHGGEGAADAKLQAIAIGPGEQPGFSSDTEKLVAEAWFAVLGRPVDRTEGFLQAGGHSLAAMRLAKKLGLTPAEVFAFPTIEKMAGRMSQMNPSPSRMIQQQPRMDVSEGIAIVGMAGRFPGAGSLVSLWHALQEGRDLLTTLPNVKPGYVPRKGVVPDDGFDCDFWGINKEQAVFMDTAQRAMLETAYDALADAGFDPFHAPGRVGVVVAGGSLQHYASEALGIDVEESRVERPDEYFMIEVGTDKDYIATQISYRLNLQGPSEVVQTACSSSLVAVVRAVQMLRLGLCEYVVCGGASFSPDSPHRIVNGMIWSPDGVCRPFASGANGTVNADGCGLIVLTSLGRARERGERVYASIKGVGVNNDGSRKAGFSAPSMEGQVEVIRMAHQDAGISGSSIDYVEAHGTGTKLGDPLEVEALREAFGLKTHVASGVPRLIGSIKGNIGHMNTAAAIPGVMKTALMLYHQRMVPSLHAETPNELIDWESMPFRLAREAHDWRGQMASVSSFGIGGTNAHIVMETASPSEARREEARGRGTHLLLLSARSPAALRGAQQELAKEASGPAAEAAVEAALLNRPALTHRCFSSRAQDLPSSPVHSERRPVVLLFPGQGNSYQDMGLQLHREGLLAQSWSGQQPADVVRSSLAIAEQLKAQGLKVEAVLGHSVGEWAAAAFAGVVSADDAIRLAELRGRLMQRMEPGCMISARATWSQLEGIERDGVEVACHNDSETIVLAGRLAAMNKVIATLDEMGISYRQLRSDKAFHTAAVDPIVPEYASALSAVDFASPSIPILSNVSGSWHSGDAAALGADYWAQHLRQPVRFAENLRHLSERFPTAVLVEVGPTALAGLAVREGARLKANWEVAPTMREGKEVETYLRCLGTLWALSDFRPQLPRNGHVRQACLPGYSYQRKALAPPALAAGSSTPARLRHAASRAEKSKGSGSDVEGERRLYQEVCMEHVDVSALDVQECAVVYDGEAITAPGWPPRSATTSYERALEAARASGGCLIFAGTADTPVGVDDTTQEQLLLELTSLIRKLAKSKGKVDVIFLLRATVRYAAAWALLRSAAREHPELGFRRLLWHDGAPLVFPVLPGEYVLHPQGISVPTLKWADWPASAASLPKVYQKALVTGGLRGLGARVAQWLAHNGRAQRLVLVGRKEATGEDAVALDRLRAEATVEVFLCDVTRWADVEALPADCDLVLHCAGAVKDGLLMNATADDMQRVLRPKVRGAVHLRRRFPGAQLLAFSSSSAPLGPAGQGTYAAANAFVDAVMPSVQWGGWSEVGMAIDLGIDPLPGERFVSVKTGLECLGVAMDDDMCRSGQRRFCVIDADWDEFRHNGTIFSPEDPLLADMHQSAAAPVLGEPRSQPPLGEGMSIRSWDLVLGPMGSRWRGTCPAWEVCQQHVVDGTPVFPATGFVALALHAAREISKEKVVLTNMAFLRPLTLAGPRRLSTSLVLKNGGSGSLSFTSFPVDSALSDARGAAATGGTLHCKCTVSFARASAEWPEAAVPEASGALQTQCTASLYAHFAAAGFHYGPSFRVSRMACGGQFGECSLPSAAAGPFLIHPAALDAALHLSAALHPLGHGGVPSMIQRLTWCGSEQGRVPSRARARCAVEGGGSMDVQVTTELGDMVCSIVGLQLSAMAAPPALRIARKQWSTAPGDWSSSGPGTCILSASAISELRLSGRTSKEEVSDAQAFALHAESLEDVKHCRQEARRLLAHKPCWALLPESRFAESAAAAAAEVGASAVIGALEDLQRIAGRLGTPPVTAKIFRLLPGGAAEEAGSVTAEPPAIEAVTRDQPYEVVVDPSKGTAGVHCRQCVRRAPGPGQVELRTSFWALNFRDALVAVGAIPAEVAGQTLGIGGECCGEVVRVGEGVIGLNVGDKVIAVPPDGMGSFSTMDARWVSRAPANLTAQEAVAGTCAYATAWLALHWMGRIEPGDRVLIHSAAGGVGLCAVHLALRRGCTVFATASSEAKRSFLLKLGVAAVFDSRSVASFERGVREVTNGEGVDVVLNSLKGDAIKASLQLLRPFGRFLELGKRDQYEDTEIGLGPFLSGLSYSAAHLDVLMLRCPTKARALLEEVWRDLPSLPKLPTKSFGMSQLPQALEYMSKGVHIGKILVSVEDTPALPARAEAVSGPNGDVVTLSLRAALQARGEQPQERGGVVCVPSLHDLRAESDLCGVQAVVTASASVAAVAQALNPSAVVLELPRWEVIDASVLDRWMTFAGHIIASDEEAGGDLQEWLFEAVAEVAGGIEADQTFEGAGLDSLALISLARRLSNKVGRTVSVVDLYDHPTPRKLLEALAGGGGQGARPSAAPSRPIAVCLHGFRSNKDALAAALAPYIRNVGLVDWVFLNAPRRATGPADPRLSESMEAFEWWGEKGGPFETGWMAPNFDGLSLTLPSVTAQKPAGAVGFSQGGAVAALVECAWVAVFSPVVPPGLRQRETPSFHSFDPNEEFVQQCKQVMDHFTEQGRESRLHSSGHIIPADSELVSAFGDFVLRQL